jgi:hypothetical protein
MPIGLVVIGGVLVALSGVILSAFMHRHADLQVPHIR